MAMGLQPRRGRRGVPMADINVTPLVDVMLVLLIIFMVTAPLLVAGVPVDLPDARAKPLKADDKPIQVSIDGKGQVFVDRLAVPMADLPAKLAALHAARSDDARLYVRADRKLAYGDVMKVVGEVSTAGFKKVALISEAHDPARGDQAAK
jgi:biopolymer transport protein TolR